MSDGGHADTRLYLVRHGHVHNPHEIAYGYLPRYGLDYEGRAQAHAAGRWLARRNIGAIFTSPLLRARQTAAIIRSVVGGVPLHRALKLRESEVARFWQGIAWREMEQAHPELYAQFMTAPSQVTTGESLAAMADRLRRTCVYAARRYPGRDLVLVSHRDPIVALRLAVTSRDMDALLSTPCQPGSITEFVLKGLTVRFAGYTEPEVAQAAQT
jgi:broad specificity phosphatase PhoE